ncbi:hypothetical protein BDN70DRAFT_615656 [Pholiota conissans]|uniref:Uncharacterized protein n=1 Tax=Pholiota conissans TaxID=109636 RepID=A0A9P5YNF4_9AGAR|nr:hypothetical protein BDN70DRAFT_615656 [Pholiota conissans]
MKLLFMRLLHSLIRGVPNFPSSRRKRSRVPYHAPYPAILSLYTQQGNGTKRNSEFYAFRVLLDVAVEDD